MWSSNQRSVSNAREKISKSQRRNPKEFFLPNRPVIRKNPELTKLTEVYEVSTKSESGYFLNPFKTNCQTFRLKTKKKI